MTGADEIGAPKAMTTAQVLDMLRGELPHDFRERANRRAKAKKLEGLNIVDWPSFEVRWDLSKEAQHFSLDGETAADFLKSYPEGFRLAWVALEELDENLTEFNFRGPEEVWGVGDNRKAAGVLLDWIEGRAVSPPIVHPVENKQVCLGGGNHRLAVARAKGEVTVPILCAPHEWTAIEAVLQLWPSREAAEAAKRKKAGQQKAKA